MVKMVKMKMNIKKKNKKKKRDKMKITDIFLMISGILESTGDSSVDDSVYNAKDVTKEDIRGLASNLFFLGNQYKYKDDQKIHGAMTAMPFKDK
eukprot:15346775-Ditylum_brightwellii.AAC.1